MATFKSLPEAIDSLEGEDELNNVEKLFHGLVSTLGDEHYAKFSQIRDYELWLGNDYSGLLVETALRLVKAVEGNVLSYTPTGVYLAPVPNPLDLWFANVFRSCPGVPALSTRLSGNTSMVPLVVWADLRQPMSGLAAALVSGDERTCHALVMRAAVQLLQIAGQYKDVRWALPLPSEATQQVVIGHLLSVFVKRTNQTG